MKKVASISSILLGLYSLYTAFTGLQAIKSAATQGIYYKIGFFDRSVIDSTLAVLGLLLFVGGIGLLTNKPWGLKLLMGSLIGMTLVLIYQGLLVMAVLVGIIFVLTLILKK